MTSRSGKPVRLPPEVNRYVEYYDKTVSRLSQDSHRKADGGVLNGVFIRFHCRMLYVRNLPFNISAEELYEIFGKYGAIRQIRLGNSKDTRGTAYVVYEDIFDAKNAQEHLSGFNVQNRYLIVLYHQAKRQTQKLSTKEEEEELRRMQQKYGVDGQQHSPPHPR